MIKKLKIIKIVIVIFIFLVIAGISFFVYSLLFFPKLSPRMDEFSLCVEEYKQVADFYYIENNLLAYSTLSFLKECFSYGNRQPDQRAKK